MFFIGVFGMNRRNKKIKEVKFKCTGCLKNKGEVIESANTFEFFFIPVFKMSKKYFLKCISCDSLYKLNPNSIESVMEKGEVLYEDIEEIVFENYVCSGCGERIEPGYDYCPKCGKKL